MPVQYMKIIDGKTIVGASSMFRSKIVEREIPINADIFRTAFIKFVNGDKIQDAFPDLNSIDREFILSGITPEEWNELFPPKKE